MMNSPRQLWINFSGKSMSPLIVAGDQLLIDLNSGKQAQFKIGQVALYHDAQEWVVHRIIGLDNDILTLKGDVGIGRDYVPASRIVGTVMARRNRHNMIEWWPQGLHFLARPMALFSDAINQNDHRLLRRIFYLPLFMLQHSAFWQGRC